MKEAPVPKPPETAEAPLGLRRFFTAFASMLELKAGPEDVERELGVSPSGTKRLGFYGVLARRNRFIALRQVCPALRHAALALEPPVWEELVTHYAKQRPPGHPDPNRFAEGLSNYLAAERENGRPFPVYLEELADYEFTEWSVGVVDFEPSREDPGLGRTIHVRHYNYDIPSFVADLRAGRARPAPVEEPQAVIIYRDVRTQWAKSFLPTPLGLAALGRRAGRTLKIPDEMAAALDSAEADLETHGILLPLARTTVGDGVP